MSEDEHNYNIAPGLLHLIKPIDDLIPLPDNYHKGNVTAVAKSYEEFGQRKSITGATDENGRIYITAGNTQWKAAKSLDWTHIAIEVFEDDRKTAVAWALSDNRTGELGENDEESLARFISEIEDDFDLLEASGYDLLDLEDLRDSFDDAPNLDFMDDDDDEPVGHQDDDDDRTTPPEREPGRPVIQYTIIFEDEEQQRRWFQFMKWLRRRYPQGDTIASRLDDFLADTEMDNG